jgi:hypothetical protein
MVRATTRPGLFNRADHDVAVSVANDAFRDAPEADCAHPVEQVAYEIGRYAGAPAPARAEAVLTQGVWRARVSVLAAVDAPRRSLDRSSCNSPSGKFAMCAVRCLTALIEVNSLGLRCGKAESANDSQ